MAFALMTWAHGSQCKAPRHWQRAARIWREAAESWELEAKREKVSVETLRRMLWGRGK